MYQSTILIGILIDIKFWYISSTLSSMETTYYSMNQHPFNMRVIIFHQIKALIGLVALLLVIYLFWKAISYSSMHQAQTKPVGAREHNVLVSQSVCSTCTNKVIHVDDIQRKVTQLARLVALLDSSLDSRSLSSVHDSLVQVEDVIKKLVNSSVVFTNVNKRNTVKYEKTLDDKDHKTGKLLYEM